MESLTSNYSFPFVHSNPFPTMALEFVGGAVLSSFLQVTFDRLGSHQVLDFFRGRKLDETLLSKLKVKLLSIDALADDAEQKQFRDSRVKAWLVAVKDAVHESEDVLDEIEYEHSKCQVEAEPESQTCTCKVPNFFKSSPLSSFNKEVKSRMEQLIGSLEFLSSQKGDLGLNNASGVGSGFGSEVSQKSPSTSLVVESVIYGRDNDKEMIINWLTSDSGNHNKLSILSIVGMGGMGKTTLAQHAYNDPRIDDVFDIKAWVCVSDDFTVFKVTRTILEAITKSTDDSRNLQMVHERLQVELKDKKFLLVLDDVWNEKLDEWVAVQTPLYFGAQGSRIIVTTRNKKVASSMRSKEHYLQQLQEDYCWQLFAEHAFQNANPQSNPDFMKIGMKIVEKCKGLPLALKTMGSLLHTKSILEWKGILESEIWELDNSDIVPALALSYHHIPSHLKRCFAYCALFPKGYLFDKECLIQFWMAQKLLQCHQQSKSPEEIGEQYFNDLLSRSFFQESSNIEGGRCFVMHDLLNDLAKYVSEDMCFRLEVDQAKTIPKATRHFSVVVNDYRYFEGFGTLYDTKRLHTFMSTTDCRDSHEYYWRCRMSIHELISKFKFLRFLSLSYWHRLTEVPDSIGNLKHLRSLDLSHTSIRKLPESTCSLYNLQILKLNDCKYLKELPSNLHKLTYLRYLEFMNTGVRKLPAHLGKQKNLLVLINSFDVGKSREFTIQQLGELNLHGRLSIGRLQNVENPSDASAVDLKNKTHLMQLELKWDYNGNLDDSSKERDEIVIENLEPSKHLERLSIRNYGGKHFPNWLLHNSLLNVVSLVLDRCQSCQRLPPLGLLPLLKNLEISGLDGIVSTGADFHGNSSSSFTSLEKLKFYNMREWEKWECQNVTSAFPSLQHLSIKECPKLKGNLPLSVPLVHLRTLTIQDCKNLLGNDGWLEFGGEQFTIRGQNMEATLLETSGHIISDTCLKKLYVYSCPEMNIPVSRCYDFLESLTICDGCNSLMTFSLDLFPTLRRLRLWECRNLQMISQKHAHNHVMYMTINECPQLELLHILLPSLEELLIKDCPKVLPFPDVGLPSNLNRLTLYNCSKFITSPEIALGAHPSLKTLDIGKLDLESFHAQDLLPHSLRYLCIYDCPSLQYLPEGLCHHSSLRELFLLSCPRLQCLPDEDLPKSISTLVIRYCPLLQPRCQRPEGEDCGKIAHIENLFIID
ncbi:hypothetical protein AAZX31_13G175200 [Glycine max]